MKKSYIIILILIITISLVIIFTKLLIIPNLMYNKDLKQDKENKEQNSEELTKVISQYNNPVIPDGFKKVETDNASWNLDEQGNPKGWNDGLVIEDEKGNQFVWVPCTIDGINNTVKYSRYIVNNKDLMPVTDNKLYDNILNQNKACYFVESDQINNEIYKSIEKNQGFYIGRFETGIENGDLLPLTNDYTSDSFTLWQNGTPIIKANCKVWNYITRYKAEEISKNFYNSNNVQSSLITSFCFDTALKWISNSIPDFCINSQNYGNYNDIKKDDSGHILTGTDKKYMYKNIYDMAGNMREFTTEIYIDNRTSTQLNVLRENHGHVFGITNIQDKKSCISRLALPKEWYNISCSFRIVLFIK